MPLSRQISERTTETAIFRVREEVQGSPVDLLVLPELWGTNPFSAKEIARDSFFLQQKGLSLFDSLLPPDGSEVIFGTFPDQNESGNFANRVLFRNASGQWDVSAEKNRPFGFGLGESQVVNPGTSSNLLESKFGFFQVLVCFDLRFAELVLRLNEVPPLIVVVASWPKERAMHWEALLRSRAIEFQAFVVGCNSSGIIDGVELAGSSMVFGPDGTTRLCMDQKAFYAACEIDLAEVGQVREAFPIERERDLLKKQLQQGSLGR